MENTWNKLKKSLSLGRISSPPSRSQNLHHSSDLSSDLSQVDSQSSWQASSSSFLRFSRSSSSSSRSNKKTCPICLRNMKAGQGRAIFTAECSHSFHFNCIASSVKHGNHLCPICRSKWKDIPFQAPSTIINSHLNNIAVPFDFRLEEFRQTLQRLPHHPHTEPHHFSDDEPILHFTSPIPPSTSPTQFPPHQTTTIKAFPEYPAVSASESSPSFAILVGLHAPSHSLQTYHYNHAPIDLVIVLDVSGSMAGTKLSLLKRAVHFVIQSMKPADRLAIVAFSSTARRIFPLRRMSNHGINDAISAIDALTAMGGTNIVEGLKKGVRIIEERRERNPVASIILLSDGKDTQNIDNLFYLRNHQVQYSSNSSRALEYMNLLPPLIFPGNTGKKSHVGLPSIPVHTFGFGLDHDATAMHAISDASGGTYSFIQSIDIIQDAFARCIGGLLSVVAQQVQLKVKSLTSGVRIYSMPSGKYTSEISNKGQLGIIEVGDLYADEEKDFLVHVSVPVFSSKGKDDEKTLVTPLLSVECSYKDPISQEMVQAVKKTVEITRPEILLPGDRTLCLEVDRERNRLWVTEAIAEAQEMAEKGNLDGAQAMLTNRRSALLGSASSQAGDTLCKWLEAELNEIRDRMASKKLYEESGRSYALSGLSSHSWQRATTRGDTTVLSNPNTSWTTGYETPSMVKMVSKSQILGTPHAKRLNKSCSLVRRP